MDADGTRTAHLRRVGRSRTAAARALAAPLSLGAAGHALAPTPAEAKTVNAGRLSISVGVDWTSAYFFRGIKLETEDPRRCPCPVVVLRATPTAS